MTLQEFKEQLKKFESIITKTMHPESKYWFFDGPFNIEKYYNSDKKILWLLKEPYDSRPENEKKSECFSSIAKSHFISHKSKQTWLPVIYISYAIVNNISSEKILEFKPIGMINALDSVSIVNVSKVPANTTTNWRNLVNSFEKNETYLKQQIDILNPDILIFGGTFDLYDKFYDIKSQNSDKTKLYLKLHNGKEIRLLHTHHPSIRTGYKKYVVDVLTKLKL